MTVRTLGLVSMVAALAAGGVVFVQSAKEAGPASATADRAEEQAAAGVAATNFQAVVPLLEQHFAANGTYAGAVVQPGYGVVLVRADAASYCLEAGAGATVQHLTGPNGTPAAGSC